MGDRENVNEKEPRGVAMELLAERKMIITFQWIVIIVLILILAAQSFYHDYKWSEFDTIVIDSNDGGNASYIGNDGDINNYGEGSSAQKEEWQEAIKGNQN